MIFLVWGLKVQIQCSGMSTDLVKGPVVVEVAHGEVQFNHPFPTQNGEVSLFFVYGVSLGQEPAPQSVLEHWFCTASRGLCAGHKFVAQVHRQIGRERLWPLKFLQA